jgi:hypothetical protein
MFQNQSYPKDRMELVFLDDTPEPFDMQPFIEKDPRIRYYHQTERVLIPVKRNRVNALAKGDIILSQDDDDFMFPDRVKHTVSKLNNSKALVAGCTELLIYHCKTKQGYKIGPYHGRHSTNGVMAIKREYLKNHKYVEDTDKNMAEEKAFLEDFKVDMVQLNPWQTIVCFDHQSNTYSKDEVLKQEQIVKPLKLELKKLIKDKEVFNFFMSLRGRDKPQLIPGVQDS